MNDRETEVQKFRRQTTKKGRMWRKIAADSARRVAPDWSARTCPFWVRSPTAGHGPDNPYSGERREEEKDEERVEIGDRGVQFGSFLGKNHGLSIEDDLRGKRGCVFACTCVFLFLSGLCRRNSVMEFTLALLV